MRTADAPAAAAVAPPAREPAAAAPAAAAAATGAAPSKYVPKWKREGDSSSQRPTVAAEQDRWVRDDRPRPALRQEAPPVRDARPLRQDAPPARDVRPLRQEAPPAARQEAPPAARQLDGAAPAASTDRWRPGSRTSANSSSTSSSTGWRR